MMCLLEPKNIMPKYSKALKKIGKLSEHVLCSGNIHIFMEL